MYFPEIQSHQAVGLNIWVYILGCKGIVSQCNDARIPAQHGTYYDSEHQTSRSIGSTCYQAALVLRI